MAFLASEFEVVVSNEYSGVDVVERTELEQTTCRGYMKDGLDCFEAKAYFLANSLGTPI